MRFARQSSERNQLTNGVILRDRATLVGAGFAVVARAFGPHGVQANII